MEPFITFRPIGRTGNLMFQTAACIGFAKKHGVNWGVPSDTREVPHFHKMFPGLPRADEGYFRTYNEHPHGVCPIHGVSYDICHFNYHEIQKSESPMKLLGFFQSEKYFENAKEEVKSAFRLNIQSGYDNHVSIHVRRGDYVQHSGSFPPVTEEYIFQATRLMEFLFEEKGWGHPKWLWFSDDREWCGEMLRKIGGGHRIAQGNEFEDLSLMASCGHHIIANSSFSWWGAWLGQNPHKVVVSPSYITPNWFGPTGGVRDPKDLIPDSWIQIKFR